RGFFEVRFWGSIPGDTDDVLEVVVEGDRDPGYGSTSKMLGESAVALARDDLDVGGGFWTPAAALGPSLLERLPENAGVTFAVV
ncbi:MAG: saccharopine dehydrogenase, partial [Actinomycetota bacterium]